MSCERNIFNEFVIGNRQFAWDAYKAARAVKGPNANVLISPLGITASLALSYYKGSNNETRKQIGKVLRFPNVEDEKLEGVIDAAVDSLFALKQITGMTMHIVNRVSVPQGKSLHPEYIDSVKIDHGIEFLVGSNEYRDDLDEWFREATSGKMKDIARHLTFGGSPSSGSFLASGVYFCGDWKTQFILKDSEEFNVSPSKVVTMPFMTVAGHFKHYQNDYLHFDLLEVLFRGERLSFLVFLPEDIDGLRKLETELTPQELKSCLSVLAALRLQKMEVSLPRFVLEDATSLKSILSKLGAISLFSEKDSDLSGMASGLHHVADAAHKVVLDIQPKGHFDSSLYSSSSSNVDVFKANHPFLFAIFDKETDMVVFIGSVVDPTLTM